MVKTIMTAMGAIPVEKLGKTSCHDHLIMGMPGWELDGNYTYNKTEVLAKCVQEVNKAKEFGLNSIIEATPADLSRDPELFRNVQAITGVNIICTTGMYTAGAGNVVHSNLVRSYSGKNQLLERLVNAYIRDITIGMHGTDVKCGVLKVSVSKGVIADLEKIAIEATALAQKETDVPIISHTDGATMGPELAAMLIEKGANPKMTMIGHSCDTDDIDYMERILKQGVYIGFDRMGYNVVFPDEIKCSSIMKLIELGYEDNILLGHDYSVHSHNMNYMTDAYEKMKDTLNLHAIFSIFIPKLKEMGLTDIQAQKLLVDNPRRFFEGV